VINKTKLRQTFGLSATLGEVLYLLLTEDLVTNADILEHATNARVAIYRLRAILKPMDLDIRMRRELGYWLNDDDKKAIIDVVAPPEKGSLREHLENADP